MLLSHLYLEPKLAQRMLCLFRLLIEDMLAIVGNEGRHGSQHCRISLARMTCGYHNLFQICSKLHRNVTFASKRTRTHEYIHVYIQPCSNQMHTHVMQVSRRKIVLEHLVVRRLGNGKGNASKKLQQSELDDILRCVFHSELNHHRINCFVPEGCLLFLRGSVFIMLGP